MIAEQTTAAKPKCMARIPARTAPTTEAQPLMAQAHGTSPGASADTRLKPSGNGRPIRKDNANCCNCQRSTPAVVQGGGSTAAKAGKHQEGGQHHGDRRKWVTEKQREALDKADLDENEAEAECHKESGHTPARQRCATGPATKDRKRQQNQNEAGSRRLHECAELDEVAGIHL